MFIPVLLVLTFVFADVAKFTRLNDQMHEINSNLARAISKQSISDRSDLMAVAPLYLAKFEHLMDYPPGSLGVSVTLHSPVMPMAVASGDCIPSVFNAELPDGEFWQFSLCYKPDSTHWVSRSLGLLLEQKVLSSHSVIKR